MNLASTLLGALAIPMLGLGWELTVGRVFWYVARVGTFNPFTWVATVLLATALNTAIEIIVVATVFDVPWTKRTVWVLFGANALSVGLAFYVVATSPFE